MIIVSQNKERCKKYNNIITISYDNDYETYEIKKEFWIVFIDGEDMGHYKTRERAKEVLQNLIQSYREYRKAEVDGYTNVLEETAVFEMPLE